jgi:hypothetical protein
MRDRIVDALGDLAHPRFLVYLMGLYKAFDVDVMLEATDTDDALDPGRIPETVDFGTLVGSDDDLEQQEAVFDLLLFVRDQLRTDPGVNAFLAVDIDVPACEPGVSATSPRTPGRSCRPFTEVRRAVSGDTARRSRSSIAALRRRPARQRDR